jgi:NitT/TauT family transport system substrate-binding protein
MIGRRDILKFGGLAAASAGVSSFGSLPLMSQAGPPAARGVFAALAPTFAGIFIANAAGIWAKNGLNVQMKQVAGGPLAMVALTNKEADFAGTATSDPVVGWDKGIKTLTIAAFTNALTLEFTARNDWMARVGISPTASLEAKLKALRGARVGASTIGGGPAQMIRYLARTVGLDPETDMKILGVGFAQAKLAAFRGNQIDIAVGDAPDSDQMELEGTGHLYLNCPIEVPIFTEYPYTVLIVTHEFATQNPDVTRRVAQSIGDANDMFHTNFGKAMDALRAQLPSLNPKLLERAMERDKNFFPRGGRMNETMWKNIIKVSQEIKLIGSPLPTEEGQIWTNKFLG